jgi:hypothetical protein
MESEATMSAVTTLPRPSRTVADLSRLSVRMGADVLPSNRAIQALAHDVLDSLKYSFTIAAADVPVSTPSPVHVMFRDFVLSRSPDAQLAHRTRATAFIQAAPATRQQTFGRFGALDPAVHATAGFTGLAKKDDQASADRQQLQAAITKMPATTLRALSLPHINLQPSTSGKIKLRLPPEVAAQAKDSIEGAKYKKLGLFIKEVECIEETSELGSDEINLGGVFTDADGKTTHVVNEFKVSHDFDEGESVLYPPPVLDGSDLFNLDKVKQAFVTASAQPGRKFAEWTIRRDLGWPTAYLAALAMAEKDSDGGFWKFLQELLGKVIEAVEKELKMGVGAAAGGAIGAALGGVWGAVVGAVVGFIVGALLDWITGDNPDDIVGTVSPVMMFGAATLSYYEWTGLLKKPHPDVFPLDFRGDGGHYRVWCYYQVYA